jgi:hypothetical protein
LEKGVVYLGQIKTSGLGEKLCLEVYICACLSISIGMDV